MTRQIYVNLPVGDLQKSMSFSRKVGFEFTNHTVSCMATLISRCSRGAISIGWCALLAVPFTLTGTAVHAADYPTKPLRMIVPFAPGGIADIVGRLVGQSLSGKWGGVQVIIDNRGGAGGNLAGELAAAAPPDGYTALELNVANAIAVSMYKGLKYDPVRDFAAVTQIGSSPFVLVVTPSLNVKSTQDLIALARARPKQLTYGSSGNGGASHLLMELLKTMAGIDMIHVPYNSSPRADLELMAGSIQARFATPSMILPLIRAGRIRALGISSTQRSALAPDLPTVAESGVPGFEGGTWLGLVVPARTPRAIVTKLNADVVEIVQRPEIRERMLAQGIEPVTSTPEEFARFIKSEVQKWSRIVALSGARVE